MKGQIYCFKAEKIDDREIKNIDDGKIKKSTPSKVKVINPEVKKNIDKINKTITEDVC